MPKKLKPNNNKKIEILFGNMERDSKNKRNLTKKEEKKSSNKIEGKTSKEKKNPKKGDSISKNPKSKVKINNEEKEKESREKSKPKKIMNLKIEKKEEKKEKNTKTKNKKLVKTKIISDSESYSISKEKENDDNIEEINFSDYKMEIEEDEKEIKGKPKNNKSNKNNKKKEKLFDEDIDIDLEEIEKIIDKEEKSIKKGKIESTNKKSKIESTNKKSTRKKSKDVKTTTNKKKDKKDTASIDSNKIDGPLSDDTIVITGEFSIKRDEITKILKNLGARVTGSVSSRTTILLHGELLEDGRPYDQGRKYNQAIEKGVKTLDLASFEKYVQEKTKNPNWTIEESNNVDDKLDLELEEEEISKESNNKKNKKKNEKNNNNTIQNQGELWTSKYQPKKLSDLIGNKTTINKLITWLDDWKSVVLEGNTKKVETKFHRGQRPTFENVNARACLISGDPGIGKTSSVRLIAKLKGYKVFESNASDQRNKNSIAKNAGFMFDNKTLFGGELQEKNLIVMDEIDGMSGNEDRGGIAAIIEIIKKTKTPIICIANDRQSPKLRSLANYCYDLKFVHPDKRTISLRLAEICKKENIQYEINALEYLCEICGNDIRQIINFIEIWSRTKKSIKYKDLVGGQQKIEGKDEVVMLSNFDAAKELLNSKSHSLPYRRLLDLYFIDYDFIPLLIQENYLSTFPSQNYSNKKEELQNISLAADLISESDVIDCKIRTNMDWRLLADRGLIGCCNICKLNKGFVAFPKFPEVMGKMSTLNKIKRETTQLKECFICSSGEEIRRQVLPVLYTILIDHIVDGDIETVLEIMRKYHISMELFKENMTDLVSEKLKLAFDKVGTSNKTNLTRAYNKNFKTSIIRKKNKKGKTQTSVDNTKVFDENGNPINEIEEENEEENDESSESVIESKKGKTKTKSKSKANKSKSKSKDNKKNNKKGKAKGKPKKKKGKKDESEEEYEEYDEEE